MTTFTLVACDRECGEGYWFLFGFGPTQAGVNCQPFCTTQASGFAGGSGTEADPYQVCLPSHLDNVRNHLSSHFIQTANIDMSEWGNFTPIGDSASPLLGSYSGSGYAISNLQMISAIHTKVGLFAQLSSTSSIVAVAIENGVVANTHPTAVSTGLLAGTCYGSISRSSTSGSVSANEGDIGGVVGQLIGPTSSGVGTIVESYSNASVSGKFAGGLSGRSQAGSQVTESYSTGDVTGTSAGGAVGGLIGILSSSSVLKTYSIGKILGSGAAKGGLIGVGAATSSSFWNATDNPSGMTNLTGTASTLEELKTKSHFLDELWDFNSVWSIQDGIDFPRLIENY